MVRSWRYYQKELKFKRWLRRFLLLLLLFLIFGAVFLSNKFIQWLNFSFLRGSTVNSLTALPPLSTFNILLGQWDPEEETFCRLGMVHLDQQQEEVSLMIWDPQIEIDFRGEKILLANLWRRGQSLNPPQGLDFTLVQLADYWALPWDGFVFQRLPCRENDSSLETQLDFFYRQIKSPSFFYHWWFWQRESQDWLWSNFSRRQLWNLLLRVRDSNDWKSFSVSAATIKQQGGQPWIDQLMQSFAPGQQLLEEGARVQVFNGTRVEGQARQVARYLKNSGLRVLQTANYKEDRVKQTRIVVFQPQLKESLARLKTLFPGAEFLIKEEKDPRADFVIIIGYDWVKRHYLEGL